jgi:methionine synthase II (cobalamin-independent)
MADTPEIPEAEDAFSKRVAITIAVLAVIISVIGNKGDNAKTDAIIKTTEAANKWAYFQSKSIKETAYETERDLLGVLAEAGVDPAKRKEAAEKCAKKIAKYEVEKQAIGPGVVDPKTHEWVEQKDDKGEVIFSAAELDHEAKHLSAINDRTDQASLFLQIGVILCSVSILIKSHRFWFAGMGLGLAGAAYGATAFMM